MSEKGGNATLRAATAQVSIRVYGSAGGRVDLDISDAIRNHLIIEIDCDGARHRLEPYDCNSAGDLVLRGYVLAGPELGWREFRHWNKLKITRARFDPRTC